MKLHTLILLFLVVILFASIWGGNNSKREKSKNKNKKDGKGDAMKETDDYTDDDLDDDAYDDDEVDAQEDDYDNDDYDDDDFDEAWNGADKSWDKKRRCPKIEISKSLRRKLRSRGERMKDVLMNWCPEPTKPINGRVKLRYGCGLGQVARYRCNPNFVLDGDKKQTCLPGRVWSGWTPKCRANCGPLPSLEHGTLKWKGTLEDDTSIAECHPTYNMTSGTAIRTCLKNRSWSGSDVVCTKIDCGNLTDPDNGSVSQTGSKVFDVASYSCNPGYKLVPEVGCRRFCLDSGNWSGFKPECIRACGPLSDPVNGEVHVTGVTEGSFAVYTCNALYTQTNGSTKRRCTDGEWTGRQAICSKLDCGNLTDPDNGFVSQTGSKVFDVASYSCNPGYKPVPEVGCRRICLDSGNWSGFKPECIRACGPLSDPVNGEVYVTGVTEGSFAVYTCNALYTQTNGSTKRRCTDGEWTGRQAICSKLECVYLPPPLHGTITSTDEGVVQISCNLGYGLTGSSLRYCHDGSWNGSEPTCNKIDHCARNPCLNGGTCQGFLGGRNCMCDWGFYGEDCESEAWKCSHWNAEDLRLIRAGRPRPEVCERVQGRKFTGGNDNLAPGCGTCGCCQPKF